MAIVSMAISTARDGHGRRSHAGLMAVSLLPAKLHVVKRLQPESDYSSALVDKQL